MLGMDRIAATAAEGFGLVQAWLPRAGFICFALAGAAALQAQSLPANDATGTVTWTLDPVAVTQRASRATLSVRGVIREGWHVYALKQSATGPTPLVISVEQNAIATAVGPAVGSTPVVALDPAFGLVTPYYARSFNVTVPVRLRSSAVPGRQVVPLSIRYQSCDGRVCLPPKTVHLAVPITITAKV